jgi:hypothetical protein
MSMHSCPAQLSKSWTPPAQLSQLNQQEAPPKHRLATSIIKQCRQKPSSPSLAPEKPEQGFLILCLVLCVVCACLSGRKLTVRLRSDRELLTFLPSPPHPTPTPAKSGIIGLCHHIGTEGASNQTAMAVYLRQTLCQLSTLSYTPSILFSVLFAYFSETCVTLIFFS